MKNNDINPVMAINPYTDKLMNLEPVFSLLKEYQTAQDCYEFTDEAIKFMALSPLPEWANMDMKGSVVMFLYALRDTFEGLMECEISVAKKKGGTV